ncbi:MAG: hypothetical protein VX438_15485 [Planctomycetota bacterium]|nr:hypothetical protein [Planctomycetota bacterium]
MMRLTETPKSWKLERQIFWAGVILLCLTQTGCSWLRNGFFRNGIYGGQSPPGVFPQQVSKEQVIRAVNANSQAIRSLQARVHVRATGTPTLSGDLSVEQPSRLRMQVGLLNMTNSGLDIGSNDSEFWVWLKSAMPDGQPPAVLYANHEEYERSSAKQTLPIEPSWVIDSLGLAYFDPRSKHEGPFQRPDGSLEIRSLYQSLTGPMIKSTMVDPRTSVVVAQELYQNGIRIASSRASKHQYFANINASIPRQVELEIGLNTPQPGKVFIELSGILPNSIDSSYTGMWEMPRPRNIRMINIGRQNGVGISGRASSSQAAPPSPVAPRNPDPFYGRAMPSNPYPAANSSSVQATVYQETPGAQGYFPRGFVPGSPTGPSR